MSQLPSAQTNRSRIDLHTLPTFASPWEHIRKKISPMIHRRTAVQKFWKIRDQWVARIDFALVNTGPGQRWSVQSTVRTSTRAGNIYPALFMAYKLQMRGSAYTLHRNTSHTRLSPPLAHPSQSSYSSSLQPQPLRCNRDARINNAATATTSDLAMPRAPTPLPPKSRASRLPPPLPALDHDIDPNSGPFCHYNYYWRYQKSVRLPPDFCWRLELEASILVGKYRPPHYHLYLRPQPRHSCSWRQPLHWNVSPSLRLYLTAA